MNKQVIYVAELFQDKVELVDRAFLANEILYFLTDFDGITEDDAMRQVMEMTDESLVDNVNRFYEGSGITYKMEK